MAQQASTPPVKTTPEPGQPYQPPIDAIPGYFDPVAGTFTPLPPTQGDGLPLPPPPSSSPTYASFDFPFVFKFPNSDPRDYPTIVCSASVTAQSAYGTHRVTGSNQFDAFSVTPRIFLSIPTGNGRVDAALTAYCTAYDTNNVPHSASGSERVNVGSYDRSTFPFVMTFP